MYFSCEKNKLYEAVINAKKAAMDKSTIPALEGILFSLFGNTLEITGYNLEIGIKTSIEVNGYENGKMVLNSKLISEIVKKLPSGDITIKLNQNLNVEVASGDILFNIMSIPAEDYPSLPSVNKNYTFTLNQALLKSMISQTYFAIATNDTKPIYTGSKFEIISKVLNVVSVDGVRMAKRSEEVDFEDIAFIVPGKTLHEILLMLSDDTEKQAEICIDRNQISLVIDNYIIISRLMEGEFIDYNKTMGFPTSSQAIINVREFSESMDRTLLLTNEKNKSPVKCSFKDSFLTVNCVTSIGAINDKISCEYIGSEIEIGFNARFMLDALKASGCDKVKLQMSGPLSPMKIVPLEGSDFTFLVLPVRLK